MKRGKFVDVIVEGETTREVENCLERFHSHKDNNETLGVRGVHEGQHKDDVKKS